MLHGAQDADTASWRSPFRHRKLLLASTAPTVPLGQLQLPLADLPPLEQVAAHTHAYSHHGAGILLGWPYQLCHIAQKPRSLAACLQQRHVQIIHTWHRRRHGG